MTRLVMGVEYDGSRYLGWQTQSQGPTVQAALEQALSRVADEPVRVHGSGRTDTGVHARGQVLHFDTQSRRALRSWILGTNSNLPEDVTVTWCREVTGDFHARFSAVGRSYRYSIFNRWMRPALGSSFLTWVKEPLDAARMHDAAQVLVGEHDFSAFRAISCQARHAVRRLDRVEIQRRDEIIHIDISGNAFLHHMVRNIVGTLLPVGRGDQPPEWVEAVLEGRDREQAGVTAPASGLCLESVTYPDAFGLPTRADRAQDLVS